MEILMKPQSEISFFLWPSLFILSGIISNFPLLFPSSTLDISNIGETYDNSFSCHIFLHFYTVYGVLMQEYWSELLFLLHTFF